MAEFKQQEKPTKSAIAHEIKKRLSYTKYLKEAWLIWDDLKITVLKK